MTKKKKRIPVGESSKNLGSLGDVLKQAGFVESVQTDEPLQVETSQPVEDEQLSLAKIVVRKETKGRKGKTVTLIEGIDWDETSLKRLAKKLRKTLGCGSHVDDGSIVLQGDLVERASKWLSENTANR